MTTEQARRYKCGDVREDGKIFWVYQCGKERWLTPEKHAERMTRRNAAARLKYATDTSIRQKASKRRKDWYAKNRQKAILSSKEWLEKNREKKSKSNRAWVVSNRKKYNEYARTWRKNSYQNNVQHRLNVILRTRLSRILKKNDCDFKESEIDVSDTIRWFKWLSDNGHTPVWPSDGVHIDHVIPISRFDLTRQGAADAVNNWRNLFPLTSFENYRKSDKIDPAYIRRVWHLANSFAVELKPN